MSGSRLVWDLPTRCHHGLLAASFLGAWWISDSERLRAQHMLLGYTVLALIGFRLLWGVIGGHHARFVHWPLAEVGPYLRGLLRRRPAHFDGHNPAGSWAALALLAGAAGTAVSGWMAGAEDSAEWVITMHRWICNGTLALVGVHLAGVLVSSLLHRENLLAAMIHGNKRRAPKEHTAPRRAIAWLLLALVLGLWTGLWHWPRLSPGSALWSWTAGVS